MIFHEFRSCKEENGVFWRTRVDIADSAFL